MVNVDVGFAAELRAGIGELGRKSLEHSDQLTQIQRAMLRPPAQPFTIPKQGSTVSGSSGDVVVDLGGPNSGRFWYVMRWTFGGRLWASAVNGVGLLVVSSTPPTNAASLGIGDVCAVSPNASQALPCAITFSRGQIVLRYPERLYAIATAPTATTEYRSSALVEQYEEGVRTQAEVT
jgi:hypothetical protein